MWKHQIAQSTLMPALLMTARHICVSSLMRFRSATEPSAVTSMPEALSRSRVSGAVKAAMAARSISARTASAVAFGTSSANQALVSKPGRPDSARSVYREVRSCAPQS